MKTDRNYLLGTPSDPDYFIRYLTRCLTPEEITEAEREFHAPLPAPWPPRETSEPYTSSPVQ